MDMNLPNAFDVGNLVGLAERIVKIAAIASAANIATRAGRTTVRNILRFRASRASDKSAERRETTIIKLCEHILSYGIYFIALLMVLQELSIDVKALLAGAGIVGLAIGFGAQNLVRDVLTGFFIIFERQFSVGDYIKVRGYEGYVEEIGLRITKIKSWTGEVHIIPNSRIDEVTNYSLHNNIAVVDVTIADGKSLDETESALREVAERFGTECADIVKAPEVLGIQDMGSAGMIYRIAAEVAPMTQGQVSRLLRKEIKKKLNDKGSEGQGAL